MFSKLAQEKRFVFLLLYVHVFIYTILEFVLCKLNHPFLCEDSVCFCWVYLRVAAVGTCRILRIRLYHLFSHHGPTLLLE